MERKSLIGAAALLAGALFTSPSWAAETLTTDQLDTVTAGYDMGSFITIGADITNYNVYNGYNYLQGPDYPGILYIEPLPGWMY